MSVGPRAEKFNPVSNDRGCTQKCKFSVLDWKYSFFGKICCKESNLSVEELKFGTQTKLNKQNSMVMFIFSFFDPEYRFWANLVPKLKIVCLK